MVVDILEGTINNLLNRQEDLHRERYKICKTCKLLSKDSIFGEVCNRKLWLNPETDETSSFYKLGFKKGCGCVISSATRAKDKKCPLNKW